MTTLLSEEIAVALALPLIMIATQALYSVGRTLRLRARARCVEHIASMVVAREEPCDRAIRALCRFTDNTIIDAVLFVSEHISGSVADRLSRIVEVCEVDSLLLQSIRNTRGLQRRHLLAKLAHLSTTSIAIELSNMGCNEGCKERFYRVVAQVVANPDHAIRHIVKFDAPFTPHEVVILVQIMRKVGAPVAYTPMLASQNRNLQLIGIYLVEHFLIVDAEPHLHRLAESEDREVTFSALHALCAIRGDMRTLQVCRAVRGLQPHHRASLMRHAVYACYSLCSCEHLLDKAERLRFAERINSYKCSIVCN